ncbi:MAG: hypothetical protein ACR2P4_04545, partial [Gammaproteobacteria bacterium]
MQAAKPLLCPCFGIGGSSRALAECAQLYHNRPPFVIAAPPVGFIIIVMPMTAALFDLDGTLIDTAPDIHAAAS